MLWEKKTASLNTYTAGRRNRKSTGKNKPDLKLQRETLLLLVGVEQNNNNKVSAPAMSPAGDHESLPKANGGMEGMEIET